MSSDGDYPLWYEPTFYKKRPETLYEKFVEAWKCFSGSHLKNSQIQEFANVDWKVQSTEEKHALVRKHIRFVKSKKPKKNMSLFDCGFSKKPPQETPRVNVFHAHCSDDAANVVEVVDMVDSIEVEPFRIESGRAIEPTESEGTPPTINASNATHEQCIFAGERLIIEGFLSEMHERCPEILNDPGADKSKFMMTSLLHAAKSQGKANFPRPLFHLQKTG